MNIFEAISYIHTKHNCQYALIILRYRTLRYIIQLMTEEQEATFSTLDSILSDEATFDNVISDVFKGIDKDGSGKLDEEELGTFINEVCAGMQIAMPPGKDNVKEVFEELDTDHSKSIDQKELGTFLRKLFTDQRNELAKALGKPIIP